MIRSTFFLEYGAKSFYLNYLNFLGEFPEVNMHIKD